MFAEIDGTNNEVPGIKIRGYPTIIYYPSNKNRNHIYYEGHRTAQDML